jgi:3',5'-cyclic AMP phosphodiesterase CpdA
MVRLAHVSDIHLSTDRLGWRLRDLFSKRVTSWLNDRLSRRKLFAQGQRILERLVAELPGRDVEHIVFSGDASALGFDAEFACATRALGVGRGLPGLAVPGNHDYCTRSAACSGAFERHFAPWQEGRRVGQERYPFAQRVGSLWLIGVNAATGNILPWDASGRVAPDQLDRLRLLLEELEPGPRVLVIHFPPCLSHGGLEPAHHGLRDLPRLIETAAQGGVGLWLAGHRHAPYHLERWPQAPFPIVCTGSTTQAGICSYNEYAIEGNRLEGVRRVFDLERDAFVDRETFTLELPALPSPGAKLH